MADERAELQHLRELDRIAELEAKAGGGSDAQPSYGAGSVYDSYKKGGLSGAFQTLKANTETPLPSGPMSTLIQSGVTPGGGIASLGAYLGKAGALPLMARTGVNALSGAASGAINSPKDPVSGAEHGAAWGGGLTLAGAAVGGGLGALGRMYTTGKYAVDPAAMQSDAVDAIGSASDKLRASEAQNVADNLAGKVLPLDTTKIRGLGIEGVNSVLDKSRGMYGELPSEAQVPATDADAVRKAIDSSMSYKQLGPFARTAEVAESDAGKKALADQIRGQVHSLSPETSDTFDQWANNLEEAKVLDRKSANSPSGFLISTQPDRRALLQNVDSTVGSDLAEKGSIMKDATNLYRAGHGDMWNIMKLPAMGLTSPLKGAASGAVSTKLTDPALEQMIQQGLFSKPQE